MARGFNQPDSSIYHGLAHYKMIRLIDTILYWTNHTDYATNPDLNPIALKIGWNELLDFKKPWSRLEVGFIRVTTKFYLGI